MVAQYSFVRSPRWLAGHVLVLVGIVAFVSLGMWQLRRLDDRRALNDVSQERIAAPSGSLDELTNTYGEAAEALEYRQAELRGRYLVGEELILVARSLQGQSGHHVLTPMLVGDRAVIVDRGWVPIDVTGPPVDEATPPGGEIIVLGTIRRSQTRGSLGAVDATTGRFERIARVDLDRLAQQITVPIYPFFVELQRQTPANELPLALPQPDFGEGPHLGYAVQWFLFAAVAVVGYPILLRRTARKRSDKKR